MPIATALALALLASGCSIMPWSRDKPRSPDEVPEWIEAARADVAAGENGRAIKRLRQAQKVEGLSSDQRIEVETLLEQVAGRRIEELAADPEGAKELEDLVDLGLPGPLAVTAGVTAARKFLEADKLRRSYEVLKDVEQRYPTHHERRAAGEILAEAGLRMAEDKRTFLGFFSLRDEGIEALEWLTVTYPSESRCDEAYFKLGSSYAETRDFQLSVSRYEDLIAYHLDSPLAVEAEARVPRMRLAGLESPEYDRRELQRARTELETWLEKHAGHELEPSVLADYADCLRRLVISDQVIARFYQRIDQAFGTRLHARRALETARQTGDAKLVQSCERLLEVALAMPDPEDARSAAGRFLDSPDSELAPEDAIEKPIIRESGGAQP